MALPYCIPYFDAHCDTLTKFNSLRQSSRNHIDLLRLHHYAPAAQVMAIWAPPGFDGPTAFRRIMLTVERELKENRDLAALCTSVAEADAAAKDDMVAVFLSVEGANLLRRRPPGLLDGYRRGVRMVTLCWNKDNRLCGSAMDTGAGLTADGVRFVNTCWEKGVAVDLSHASEKTFWDVMRIAKRPVLCSHSNAKSVCDHPRNLTDAQISAIVHNEGVIGLASSAPPFSVSGGIWTPCSRTSTISSAWTRAKISVSAPILTASSRCRRASPAWRAWKSCMSRCSRTASAKRSCRISSSTTSTGSWGKRCEHTDFRQKQML